MPPAFVKWIALQPVAKAIITILLSFNRSQKLSPMKQILKATTYLLIASSLFVGCKKESSKDGDNTSTYYVKGKKDGTAFHYSANAGANIINFSSVNMISLALVANAQSNPTNLEGLNVSINFFNGKSPATGTYTEEYAGTDYLTAGVFNPNSTSITWAAGSHSPTAKPLKIVILTKTATEITGTFEGAFYKQDVSIPAFYDDVMLFTECEFKLPITQ
jgi:hypothetical protein